MVIVLVGVALITGAILAYVNNITTGPIQEQAEKTLTDGIKEALFIIHTTQDTKGNALGAAVESTTSGFGGDLKVLVGFNQEGNILGYTILQTAETPGLGAKAEGWFQKDGKGSIIGKNPSTDNLTVSKDGGSVNAITASTITSRAFLLAVNNAYNAYKKGADSNSGATKVNNNLTNK